MADRLIISFIPALQVFSTASFVNAALLILNDHAPQTYIFPALLLLLFIIAYGYITASLIKIAKDKLQFRLSEDIQTSVVEKRGKLHYSHIENEDTWQLVKRVGDTLDSNIYFGFMLFLRIMETVIQIVSILTVLVFELWWIPLVVLAFSIPMIFAALKSGKEQYEAFKESSRFTRKAEYLHELLIGRANVDERMLFGYTDHLSEKWYEQFELARAVRLKARAMAYIRSKSAGLLVLLASFFIVATLIFPLVRGQISVGVFIGLVNASLSLTQTMAYTIGDIVRDAAKAKESLGELHAFAKLSETKDALSMPSKTAQNMRISDIVFQNVSFRYPGTDKMVFHDLSLTLEPNTHYAVVGINGAGKTTLTKLLIGLYDNYEGNIYINGKELRAYSLSELKGLFSVLFQDFARYHISVEDNILLGNMAGMAENMGVGMGESEDRGQSVWDALARVEVDGFVRDMPGGIRTNLGKIIEDSIDISGGEWQKLAIARTIYNKAPIRILDEPTAALDPISESNLYKLFKQISTGTTTLFITHRLGAAKLADKIILIDAGRVSEFGTHDELMTQNGAYHSMFESQRSWYEI